MDRSNFYYDQEVTEAELDQAFDDVERMEQDRTIDDDLWGVWNGLIVQEAAVPDLTVDITAGVAHDELGRRIENPSTYNLDLSSYVPPTPGDVRKVHIYVEDFDVESDPRTDGHAVGLNYRLAEGFAVHVEAGAIANPGPATPPGIVANKVLLAEVDLAQGMASITNSEIASDEKIGWLIGPTRQQGGVLLRRGRLLEEHLVFDFLTNPYSILYPDFIEMRNLGQGIDMGQSPIIDCHKLTMRQAGLGGLGIDMENTPVDDAEKLVLRAGSGQGIDTGGKYIDVGGSNVNLVGVNSADIPTTYGFRYRDRSTGAAATVHKWVSVDASDFKPGNRRQESHLANKHPWMDLFTPTNTDEHWYIWSDDDGGQPAAPPLDVYMGWRYRWDVIWTSGYMYSQPLFVPLNLPHSSKIVSCDLFLKAASVPSGTEIGLYLYRKRRDVTTIINDSDDPNWTSYFGADGDKTLGITIDTTYEIVSGNAYTYYAVVMLRTSQTRNSWDSGHLVTGLAVGCDINEASGVWIP